MTQTDHNTGSSPSLTEHVADGQGRDDAGVLLGLEPTSPLHIEKAGQNLTHSSNLDIQPCYAPLLGTRNASGMIRERPASGLFSSITRPRLAD